MIWFLQRHHLGFTLNFVSFSFFIITILNGLLNTDGKMPFLTIASANVTVGAVLAQKHPANLLPLLMVVQALA